MTAQSRPTQEPARTDDPRADLRWGTTGALVADAARRIPRQEAIVEGELRLTYQALDAAVTTAARGFLAAGLDKGDRVAIWAPNSARWIIAALGLQRAGGVLVPLNTRFKGAEAAFVLGKSQARILCTVSGFLGRDYPADLAAAQSSSGATLPALEQIVMLEGEGDRALSWDGFLATGASVPLKRVERRATQVGPDDLSDMMFTSGTTGNPKGAMSTHAQTLRAYGVWSRVVGLREGDRYLIVNPFFHGFGYKAGWLSSFIMGATVLPARTLDVPWVLDVVRRERVTVLPGTPTLYQTMLEHPGFSADGVASLRLAVTGAANVPPTIIYRIKAELGFEHLVQGYGLTETCGIVSMCRYDDPLEVVVATTGRPIPGVEAVTVDRDGRPVPAGAEGEILVRGYNVMKGYFGEEAETAATIDADGWLHTGDIGVIDEAGRISITDRIKDMYIVGGFNAYPAEIESVLSKHPAVAQAAVIGVPDERQGEIGMAFVVPRKGTEIDTGELIAWSRRQMANYKVPGHVRVVEELPVNAAGKVLKTALRERSAAPGARS